MNGDIRAKEDITIDKNNLSYLSIGGLLYTHYIERMLIYCRLSNVTPATNKTHDDGAVLPTSTTNRQT